MPARQLSAALKSDDFVHHQYQQGSGKQESYPLHIFTLSGGGRRTASDGREVPFGGRSADRQGCQKTGID